MNTIIVLVVVMIILAHIAALFVWNVYDNMIRTSYKDVRENRRRFILHLASPYIMVVEVIGILFFMKFLYYESIISFSLYHQISDFRMAITKGTLIGLCILAGVSLFCTLVRLAARTGK